MARPRPAPKPTLPWTMVFCPSPWKDWPARAEIAPPLSARWSGDDVDDAGDARPTHRSPKRRHAALRCAGWRCPRESTKDRRGSPGLEPSGAEERRRVPPLAVDQHQRVARIESRAACLPARTMLLTFAERDGRLNDGSSVLSTSSRWALAGLRDVVRGQHVDRGLAARDSGDVRSDERVPVTITLSRLPRYLLAARAGFTETTRHRGHRRAHQPARACTVEQDRTAGHAVYRSTSIRTSPYVRITGRDAIRGIRRCSGQDS